MGLEFWVVGHRGAGVGIEENALGDFLEYSVDREVPKHSSFQFMLDLFMKFLNRV
jgi:hypothetical protein